jgi:RNA polymerase sigma factor (sigma-70 family)
MNDSQLGALVEEAKAGDAAALERVVRAVQDEVFDFALRMLGDPTDAQDASQEVLVRIVTKLGSFRGESKFRTWVYRLAANTLLNFRAGGMRRKEISFDEAEEIVQHAITGGADAPLAAPDLALVNEVCLVCTHGMLLCLDRAHRLAYVLGEVLELTSDEGGAVLEISQAAFRKRLSRARESMEAFLKKNCGIADPANACRCTKLLPLAQSSGLVDPERLVMARLPTRETNRLHLEVRKVRTAAEIFRSMPKYRAPDDFAALLRAVLNDGPGGLLSNDSSTGNNQQ